jgi:hypothetical protein
MRRVITLFALSIALTSVAFPQHDHGTTSNIEHRGDAVMGFDHDKTTHHFGITKNGGTIQVTANDAKDKESITAIRSHLPHVMQMFAKGDFNAPMLIHDKVPPGSKVMAAKKDKISYSYADIDRGGKISITTSDPEVLKAIDEFLTMQIKDHKTGDSLKPHGGC